MDPYGAPTDSPARPLVELARAASLTRPAVHQVANEIAKRRSELPAAISNALEALDGQVAAVLLVAAATLGIAPRAEDLERAIPILPDPTLVAVLVGVCAGDRVDLLCTVAESGRLSVERHAFVLLIATELVGAEAPPRLLTQIRLLSREPLQDVAGVVLGLAAGRVQDPDTRRVCLRWIARSARSASGNGDSMLADMRRWLTDPVIDSLPEREPLRRIEGFTVRRPVEKIGRNDPCPCGSGRKYKRCCADKDEARRSDPSPVVGMTMAEVRASPEKFVEKEGLAHLRPAEIARLDFEKLATRDLIEALRTFTSYRYWEHAERAMAALAVRTDLPGGGDADGYRDELLFEATRAGEAAVVRRQVALLRDPEIRAEQALPLAILEPSATTLATLEEAAVAGLRHPGNDRLLELAFALLSHFPGLGIVTARAALDPERALDVETALREVEAARDRLQLPPGDVAHEIYGFLLDRESSATIERFAADASDRSRARLVESVEEQRRLLRESNEQLASLDRQLRERTEELKRATSGVRTELPTQTAASPSSSRSPSERGVAANVGSVTQNAEVELRRLRGKVAELKGLIAEGQSERRELREELVRATQRIDPAKGAVQQPRPVEAPSASCGRDLDLEESLDGFGTERLSTLIPACAPAARDALLIAPAALARQALRVVALLAGADPAAWSMVKKLRLRRELYSARVGIHHRLLLRIDTAARALEVTAFIHRRELEETLRHVSP